MLLIWTRCLKRRFAVGDNESDGSALSFSVYLGFIMSPFVFVFGCLSFGLLLQFLFRIQIHPFLVSLSLSILEKRIKCKP